MQGEWIYHGVPEFNMYDNQWEPHGEVTMVTRMFVQIARLTLRWTSVTEKADKRSVNSRTD